MQQIIKNHKEKKIYREKPKKIFGKRTNFEVSSSRPLNCSKITV